MQLTPTSPLQKPMPIQRIFHTWWPLAASWLLMSAELPALSAVVARLPNPEINLAAYGGVVSPLSLIIESPIIMLLAASTALSKDWGSYQKLRRFMMAAGAALTLLHVLVAFTPLYHIVVVNMLGAPAEIVEPARLGLKLMLPWTWSIAYRRFNQGVLIRFGHSKTIGVGTFIRLSADGLVLAVGYLIGTFPGVVVAASAVAAGVISEAVYVGIVVRPVLKYELKLASPLSSPITLPFFLNFYIPLAMTSLLGLLVQPIGSAALSRMPEALASLAAWPVVSGLVSVLRSLGMAYNEVVVALLDEPGSSQSLRSFATWMAILATLFLLLVAATPLSRFWFVWISALNPELARISQLALWIALPMPGLTVMQSWFQGSILHSRRTRGITEAVILFLLTSGIALTAGILWGRTVGLFIGMASFAASTLLQTAWLWMRSRPVMKVIRERDADYQLAPSWETPVD